MAAQSGLRFGTIRIRRDCGRSYLQAFDGSNIALQPLK
jgi:hypothetical protein